MQHTTPLPAAKDPRITSLALLGDCLKRRGVTATYRPPAPKFGPSVHCEINGRFYTVTVYEGTYMYRTHDQRFTRWSTVRPDDCAAAILADASGP